MWLLGARCTRTEKYIHLDLFCLEKTAWLHIDMRGNSGILDVRSFRGADSDTDHYLMGAQVIERLAVSKQTAQSLMGKDLTSGS